MALVDSQLERGKEPPSLRTVLDILDDQACRAILRTIGQPTTAPELADSCDIAESTVYRKLERLEQATLIRSRGTIGPEGGRVRRYERHFDELRISLDADDEFRVRIERPDPGAQHRLAGLLSASADEL